MKLLELVCRREEYLKRLLKQKESEIQQLPVGSIRVGRVRKSYQYYLVEKAAGKKVSEKYISKKKMSLIKALVQREYDEKVIRAIKAELKNLANAKSIYKDKSVEDVYYKMPVGKQILIKPIMETEEQYLNRILSEPFTPLGFERVTDEYYTLKNERVRSKSELIIADMLNHLNIPYIYEKPLKLQRFGMVYPDFTIIDVKKRRTIFLEHFGRMDDPEYVNKNIPKINAYINNGYMIGDRLLMSFETSEISLNNRSFKNMIMRALEISDESDPNR